MYTILYPKKDFFLKKFEKKMFIYIYIYIYITFIIVMFI